MIEETQPKRVVFLGDLFHSSFNKEWHKFEALVQMFSEVKFELVKGNHDIIDHRLFVQTLHVTHDKSCHVGPFLLTHDPQPQEGCYNLCGHIHPAVHIKGRGLQSIRLPCFFFSEDYAILPAFGSFTGSHTLVPSKKDSVYIIAENEVIKV